jgi:hypothetical protein
MSNYTLSVDFFGNTVRAETEGSLISLNDLINAGNAWRLSKGLAAYQMHAFLNSRALKDYIQAASDVWEIDRENFIVKRGKGKSTRTMVHIAIAVLAAEQISPWFHATVHKTFIEGKLLEFRELGGTEFKELNAAVDSYLPCRDGKNNKGIYINAAKMIREKIIGKGAEAGCWDTARVAQIHDRYRVENQLVSLLKLGLVKDWEHMKELIPKI